MSKHTPEPWETITFEHNCQGSNEPPRGLMIVGRGAEVVTDDEEYYPKAMKKDNMIRVVSCVNALAGIADPKAWVKAVKELLSMCSTLDVNINEQCTEEGFEKYERILSELTKAENEEASNLLDS